MKSEMVLARFNRAGLLTPQGGISNNVLKVLFKLSILSTGKIIKPFHYGYKDGAPYVEGIDDLSTILQVLDTLKISYTRGNENNDEDLNGEYIKIPTKLGQARLNDGIETIKSIYSIKQSN